MPMAKVASTAARAGRKIARVAKLNYLKAASAVNPDRKVSFYLDRPFNVCLPFRTEEQLKAQLSSVRNIKPLEQDFGPANFILVTISGTSFAEAYASEASELGNRVTYVPDFRSLVSFLAGAQFHIVLPEEGSQDRESLKQWCDSFHVSYFLTAAHLCESLTTRGPLELSGPLSATYAVHKNLWLNVMGNQYAFTEPLDWRIIKKLPNKFIEFRTSIETHAYPISLLSGPLNRIERQRAIGKLYKNYLQGESVVDIGCDVRGVEEFIGPQTRYQGIDMHGRPDILLNVDRDDLPFSEKSIDTVVCVEALEHLQAIHKTFDKILSVSKRYVICSLPVEAAFTRNKLVDSLGGAFSFSTPLAPVFDRHQWVGSVSDNLDFIYYRAELNGFAIKRVDLFYMPRRGSPDQGPSVLKSFREGNVKKLNEKVGLIIFVLARNDR